MFFDEDIEIGPQEYIVSNVDKVGNFIDKEIGVDYEKNRDENYYSSPGSVMVFDLLMSEHMMLKKYISKEKLWG